MRELCPELARPIGEIHWRRKLGAQCCCWVAKVRDSLPDMARFEVTEANWVRAAGLATLGAAEAMSLEAKRADDILMISVLVGRRILQRGEEATRDAHTHTRRSRGGLVLWERDNEGEEEKGGKEKGEILSRV